MNKEALGKQRSIGGCWDARKVSFMNLRWAIVADFAGYIAWDKSPNFAANPLLQIITQEVK